MAVNLVRVEVGTPRLNPFRAGAAVDGATVGIPVGRTKPVDPKKTPPYDYKFVTSVGAGAQKVGFGLDWKATITFVGPPGNAGVREMRAGFVQVATVQEYNGTYNGNIPGTQTPLTRVSRLQGNSYWDTRVDHYGAFYSKINQTFSGLDQIARKNNEIESNDPPGGGPPTQEGAFQLISMRLVWVFDLYVAAITTEKTDSSPFYAPEANVQWTFNGTGDVTPPFPYRWTGINRAQSNPIVPPTAWQAATVDTRAPLTDGSLFNDQLNTAFSG